MSPERWQELKRLFNEALDKTAEQRAELLARLRSDNPGLADELERLLLANDAGTVSMDRPALNGHDLIADEPYLLHPGEIFTGRFQIVRCIGRGGMGEVYEADDRHMGRVAIKIIRPEIVRAGNIAARFRAEAKAARSVTTPLVCRIHEFLTAPAENGRPEMAFLTMEFLEGRTLWDRMKEDGPFSPKQAEHLAVQLCRGLQAIHDAGFVHRDLKARNIMLVKRQSLMCPVIMDFGLARNLLALDGAGLSITEMGAVVGTPEYMAPEQFEGREVKRTADIYALGIVLYEMVVGKHPFEASTPLGAAVRRAKRPPSACSVHPEFPRRWDRVIERCLEYDADRRFQSADAVAQALCHRASDIGRLPQAVADVSSHRPAVWIALLAVFACAGGVAALRWPHVSKQPAEAVRWFNEGISAIRDGTYLKATHLLEQALHYDKNFALAHARLADAWAELDFQGKAEHEMLLASAGGDLSGLDREYFEAIRASITGDFTKAARQYEQILKDLPAAEKATGYLDLGRLYEKAGETATSVNYYKKAENASPSLPLPYLRLAILENRGGNSDLAAKDFSKAKTLYEERIDDEGLAEVDYQLGFAATVTGNLEEAREDEKQSLAAARRIKSPQLETRALTRLAVIAYKEDSHYKDGKDQCIENATEAIKIARDNNLRYWDVEARIRIGNDLADHLRFDEAESYHQTALKDAEEGQLPRLEALANWGLAISRDLQGNRPDEALRYAKSALAFYEHGAFLHEALSNRLLIARAQEGMGDFNKSLESALAVAEESGRLNDSLLPQAEEAVGQAYSGLEDYPAALKIFESALAALRSQSDEGTEFQAMHCADLLWRLGRYGEAESILRTFSAHKPKQPRLDYDIARINCEMRLSKKQYREALGFAQQAESLAENVSDANLTEIRGILAVIQCHLHNFQKADELCRQASALSQAKPDAATLAMTNLIEATVLFKKGNLSEANSSAETAYRLFRQSGEKHSEWQSLLILAQIQERAGNREKSKISAATALEILSGLRHDWGFPVFSQYASRPDLSSDVRQLQLLSGGNLT